MAVGGYFLGFSSKFRSWAGGVTSEEGEVEKVEKKSYKASRHLVAPVTSNKPFFFIWGSAEPRWDSCAVCWGQRLPFACPAKCPYK